MHHPLNSKHKRKIKLGHAHSKLGSHQSAHQVSHQIAWLIDCLTGWEIPYLIWTIHAHSECLPYSVRIVRNELEGQTQNQHQSAVPCSTAITLLLWQHTEGAGMPFSLLKWVYRCMNITSDSITVIIIIVHFFHVYSFAFHIILQIMSHAMSDAVTDC